MKKLLLHLDTDTVASTFDQAVAYDSGVDNIIAHGGATRDNVTAHVHGMIFTRGGKNLKNSAIFIGGSNVPASELVGEAVKKHSLARSESLSCLTRMVPIPRLLPSPEK